MVRSWVVCRLRVELKRPRRSGDHHDPTRCCRWNHLSTCFDDGEGRSRQWGPWVRRPRSAELQVRPTVRWPAEDVLTLVPNLVLLSLKCRSVLPPLKSRSAVSSVPCLTCRCARTNSGSARCQPTAAKYTWWENYCYMRIVNLLG